MNNALRAINLLVIALVLIATNRGAGGDDPQAAQAAGHWTRAALISVAPLLAMLALGRNASAHLRTAAVSLSTVVLVLFGGAALFALTDSSRFAGAMVGGTVFALLCAVNIWAVRSLARREARGEYRDDPAWFAARYWRGEFPLGTTYWAGGILLLLFQFLLASAFGLVADSLSLRTGAWAILSLFLTTALLLLWQSVSVWRSATRRAHEGTSAWPVLAKLSVFAGVLMFGLLFVNMLLPTLREHALIAVGRDPLPPLEARTTTGDSVLLLHGTFGSGSAERVRRLLDAHTSIRTVALSSNGGRLREASDIAYLVRQRQLDTYVDTRCESACTFVFLAGKDRAATPNARIGFHRPSFAGMSPLGIDRATESMLGIYRNAGIPPSFLERVAATAPRNMWYPTRQELEEAGVINRISLGGETSAIGFLAVGSRKELRDAFGKVPMMAAMERHFPGTIDAAVQAAWMERTQGGIDSAVNTAARSVIAERYPKILAAADDSSLDVFAQIMIEQMKAARAISSDACRLLLAGQLNVEQVLQPALVQREQAWALDILRAETLVDRALVDPDEFQRVLVDATALLPEEVLNVVGEPEKYRDEPARWCDATIALYDRIAGLPDENRHLLLRGMFQAGAL